MRLLHVTCAALIWATSAAAAENAARARGDRLAYEAAVKCFVVAGAAAGEREDAGDAAQAAAYDAKARQSFNVATMLGHRLGLSNGSINQDFGLAQTRELPRIVANAAYRKSTAATCKAMGLM